MAMLSTSNPEKLNKNELLYAATLTEDNNTKLKVYKSGTTIYPQVWEYFNNAAYINLELGNIDEAISYLNSADKVSPNNPTILNNLGVAYAWKKDYTKAKSYYQSAKSNGGDVNHNLCVIMIKESKYDNAVTALSSKKCNYNLALAQLLSGDKTSAAKTLECSPKTAEVYYLKAVVGARNASKSDLLDNLKKACEMAPMYKAEAKEDVEFRLYFDDAEFKNIVG